MDKAVIVKILFFCALVCALLAAFKSTLAPSVEFGWLGLGFVALAFLVS